MSLARKSAELAALRRKALAFETAPPVHIGGRFRRVSWDQLPGEEQAKLAEEGSTILNAAIHIIQVAASSPPWVAERRKGDGWEPLPPDHPASQIVAAPNGFDDGRALVERLVLSLVPTGNHLWYKAPGVGRGGELPPISAVWPLVPSFGPYEMGEDDYPISYRQGALSGGEWRGAGRGRIYLREEVVHFQRPSIRQLGWGSGVVNAARRLIASDISTAEWQAESYENRLVPDGAFVAKGVLDPEKRRIVQEAIEGKAGPARARETLMLEGDWRWERASLTAVEADYINTRRAILEELCAAVNVRPALLVPDASYANLEESRESLWLDNVLPLLDAVTGKVTRQLGPHFGKRGEIRWRADTSKIEALRELLLKRFDGFQKAVNSGVPYNAAIDVFGLPLEPLPPEIGDVPHGASLAVALQRVRQELGLPIGLASAHLPRSLKVLPAERLALPAIRRKAEDQARTASLFAAARSLERRIAGAYRALAAKIQGADEERGRRIVRALAAGDAGAASAAAGVEILRSGLGLTSNDPEGPGDVATLLALIAAGAREGLALGAEALSRTAGVDLAPPPAAVADAWVGGWAPERAGEIVASTERGLTETVAEWRALPGWGEAMAAGLAGLFAALAAVHAQQASKIRSTLAALVEARGLEEAARRVLRMAEKAAEARGAVIAAHNATTAIFGGQQQAAADLLRRGTITSGRRRWIDSDDGKVCPDCGGLDGEEAALDEPYVHPVTGASYWTPGDPHPECRCGEIYYEITAAEAA